MFLQYIFRMKAAVSNVTVIFSNAVSRLVGSSAGYMTDYFWLCRYRNTVNRAGRAARADNKREKGRPRETRERCREV